MFIVPLYALTNVGIAIDFSSLSSVISSPVTTGIIVGRIIGKLLGITLFAYIAVKIGIAKLPESLSFKEIAGAGALAGMGLTVSLLIANLAFKDAALLSEVKIGLLISAIISAVLGLTILRKYSVPQD